MNNGIFCLENYWGKSVRDQSTVQPILELLQKQNIATYLYHRCATRPELEFMLNRWRSKSNLKKYPILYFAFHGSDAGISIGKEDFSLDEIASVIGSKCNGAVFFFGCCETMSTNAQNLKRFLKSTNGSAVMGFQNEVGWMESTAFEMLVLDRLLNDLPISNNDFLDMESSLKETSGKLFRSLGFRLIINPDLQ